MLSSVYDFGISKRSGDMLSRNSNFWNVILAETVGKIGISIFTGKPLGSFRVTNSRNLLKCLNGAITSRTFSSISTVSGKSLLCNKKWNKSIFVAKKIKNSKIFSITYVLSPAAICLENCQNENLKGWIFFLFISKKHRRKLKPIQKCLMTHILSAVCLDCMDAQTFGLLRFH